MTLREAIEQAINLGESDPVAIAHQIILRHGAETVFSELDPVEYATAVAKAILGNRRRAGIRSLSHINTAHKRDLMLDVKWLPGLGYVKLGDCTADDFDLAAATYEKAAGTLTRYAIWCRAQSALIREQGVEHYRQVKGALPGLPPAEEAA